MKDTKDFANHCPICRQDNRCGNMASVPQGACWCSKTSFPEEIFELVPEELMRKSCICENCLEAFRTRTDKQAN